MHLYELLNKLINLIEKCPENMDVVAKTFLDSKELLVITSTNIEEFNDLLDLIYRIRDNVYSRFTRQRVYNFIEARVLNKKRKNEFFKLNDDIDFFSELENKEPLKKHIIAPISGLRLDHNEKIKISTFEIGKSDQLKSPISNDTNDYYIAVEVEGLYDELLAIEQAKNKFYDFIRLIVFISGKNDKKILIKTGLPSYPSLSHDRMYVETSSYQILDTMDQKFPATNINNTYFEKIPIDNKFFYDNDDFKKLWEIYKDRDSKNVSSIENRILNASIALGESALSKNTKNSIIYTSMALEILFSYDEGSLFQKSIGDKLADTFAFMVGTNKESRINASKELKKFYSLRSALVHGGDTKMNNDYIIFNIFLRAIIKELLNNEKYKHIKKIEDLYSMVKEAQYSY